MTIDQLINDYAVESVDPDTGYVFLAVPISKCHELILDAYELMIGRDIE